MLWPLRVAGYLPPLVFERPLPLPVAGEVAAGAGARTGAGAGVFGHREAIGWPAPHQWSLRHGHTLSHFTAIVFVDADAVAPPASHSWMPIPLHRPYLIHGCLVLISFTPP